MQQHNPILDSLTEEELSRFIRMLSIARYYAYGATALAYDRVIADFRERLKVLMWEQSWRYNDEHRTSRSR